MGEQSQIQIKNYGDNRLRTSEGITSNNGAMSPALSLRTPRRNEYPLGIHLDAHEPELAVSQVSVNMNVLMPIRVKWSGTKRLLGESGR